MREVFQEAKEQQAFQIFLIELEDLKDEELPLLNETEVCLEELFDGILPYIVSRSRASPRQTTASDLWNLYVKVQECLKIQGLNEENACGPWWSDLRKELLGFASAYENDPHFPAHGMSLKCLGPNALELNCSGWDTASRTKWNSLSCKVSDLDSLAIRQVVDKHISHCLPVDPEARLASLSAFQSTATRGGLASGCTRSEHSSMGDHTQRYLDSHLRKAVGDAYRDSISKVRDGSLCLTIEPDSYAPGGEELTTMESSVLAQWINCQLLPSLQEISEKVWTMDWTPEIRLDRIRQVDSIKDSPLLDRLAAYKDGTPASKLIKVKHLQELYTMLDNKFSISRDGESTFWNASTVKRALSSGEPQRNEMADHCAWLRKFHATRSKPTIDIQSYRSVQEDDSVLFAASGSGGTVNEDGSRDRVNKFILSLDEASTKYFQPSRLSQYSEFVAMCGLTPGDIKSMISCLQSAKASVGSGTGISNDNPRLRKQFCDTLDRTISALMSEAKTGGEPEPRPSTASSVYTDATDEWSISGPTPEQ